MYGDRPPLKPMLKSFYLLFWTTRTPLYGFSVLTLFFTVPWLGILSVSALILALGAQLHFLTKGLARIGLRTFSITPSLLYHYVKRTVLDSLPAVYLSFRLLRKKLYTDEPFYDKTRRNKDVS